MKHVLFMATVLTVAGSAIAGDNHHGHHGHHGHHHGHHGSHFGLHFGGHHGLHYGLHSYHHGGHHSGFGFGLLLGRSHGYYSYPSSRYYSTPRYYRTRRYRSYSYSNPSCVIQISPPAPRRELQNPATRPLKKKVEPAPQSLLPSEPAPNAGSFDYITAVRVSVASTRTGRRGIRIQPAQSGKATSADPTLGIFGPQLAAPQTRSLVADDAIPFVVPLQQDRPTVPVTYQKLAPRLPPSPASPVVDEPAVKSKRPSIPKAMQGISLLPVADQKLALSQRTCPVTDDLLGADGKPIKVPLRGQTVFVCCKGCVAEVKHNPDRFLIKR